MTQVELKLPRLIEVSDYHEFRNIEDMLKQLNKTLRCAEVGFTGSHYVGVIYKGRRPGKAELREQARRQKMVLEGEVGV